LIVTVACLGVPFSFSSTVSVTALSPWPEGGSIAIQSASLLAVQAHSRATMTLVRRVPPAAAMV
jgi:hypothetical protein